MKISMITKCPAGRSNVDAAKESDTFLRGDVGAAWPPAVRACRARWAPELDAGVLRAVRLQKGKKASAAVGVGVA